MAQSNKKRKQAYREGQIAGNSGKPITDCPYKKSLLKRSWELGWYDSDRGELRK